MPLSGREKATIFLSILGAETAARVLRYLPDELADLIAANLNHLPSPSPDALAEVLNDLKGVLALSEPTSAPPPQISPVAMPANRFKQQYQILIYERPQMTAFILAQLPPQDCSEALLALPREKPILVQLLAHQKINPLRVKLAQKLREQFKEKLFSAVSE